MGNVDGVLQNVYIVGRKNMNRSIQGDTVAVEILPKSEWKKTASVAIEEEEDEDAESKIEQQNGNNSDQMDTDEALPIMPTGKVVGIIRKKWRPYCGFISKKSIHGSEGSTVAQNVIFRAMDRRIPSIKIRTTQAHTLAGQRIVVSIDSWPTNSL
jgi:exosome complex exonuclease DIS3/RRP44